MKQKMSHPMGYEHISWTNYDQNGQIALKADKILSFIPVDVKTIIDIGCGNGLITNRLSEKHHVVGVDKCQPALEFVKTKRIMASSEQIGVSSCSFDMVFSSELLEHLEDDMLHETVREIKRISKKYILITVPNDETVETASYQCPYCKYVFNEFYHVRNFNIKIMQELFFEYTLLSYLEYGPPKRGYHPQL